MKKMFEGDNVATHLSKLFDHTSQTYSISANVDVSVCVCVRVSVCVCVRVCDPTHIYI